MVFTAPNWVDPLPAIPDNIPISEFMLNEQYGRHPVKDSRDPFTCGFTGKTYSAAEMVQRVDSMARGLAEELGWEVNKGTEWDKVLGIFSYNTVSLFFLAGILCVRVRVCVNRKLTNLID